MIKESFYEGLLVEYKDQLGVVTFTCTDYITVCVSSGHSPLNDLCILVYKEDWNKVKLLKESKK